LDATVIDLCLSLYDWAKFRTTKGAVKLHVKLNHAGYLPNFAVITEAAVHEQKSVVNIPLERNDVVVFDRGYPDFGWYRSLIDRGIFFVTRLKKNADYKVVGRRSVKHLKDIYSDQIIELKGFYTKQKYPYLLRRIRRKDAESGKIIVVLTNQFNWSAKTVSKIHKDRWQIELFFKSLKQQLKVKSFLGTSKNALLSQLWVALTAYLMLSYLKFRSKFQWSVYTLMEILPVNIFSKRHLWDWLDDPYHQRSKNKRQCQQQLNFNFV
jgi:putative transposase